MNEELVPVSKSSILVALSAGDLPGAQAKTIEWVQRKIESLETHKQECVGNYEEARKAKWKSASWQAQITKTKASITYYEKIRIALEAGYQIIPNFPVSAFAIRVGEDETARIKWSENRWSVFTDTPSLLESGEGKYVSDRLPQYQTQGEDKAKFYSGDYQDVDFPVKLVRPVVLEATRRAMERRVFDQFAAVVNSTKGDPIVVGQVFDRYRNRTATFFISWWLDLESF
ncbi:MAG: hypothetical protein Q8P12_05500 [bacterium]|nr:hypothetical protein [bacterium]MDZ4346776.1 hypothetical protein [Candidatus Binatia bacterium]